MTIKNTYRRPVNRSSFNLLIEFTGHAPPPRRRTKELGEQDMYISLIMHLPLHDSELDDRQQEDAREQD